MYGDCIKKIRKGLGLTQSEFGEKIDVSQTHLSQIESGLKMPSREVIENMSYVFDIPIAVLYLYMSKEEDLTTSSKMIMHKYQALFENILNEFIEKRKKNGLHT
jgi:transcriptional regulator with XRE-family HTH domain